MNDDAQSVLPPPGNGPAVHSSRHRIAQGARQLLELLDVPIPADCVANPELMRRARLISRFGVLGALFGALYATFYLLIGHRWGVLIILLCSSCFAATPFFLRRQNSLAPASQFLILILTLGFTALSFVEGGLQGHAIAWLVSVPLCALLLLGKTAATRWALIAFVAAGLVVSLDLLGVRLPVTYDPQWNSLVSAAGYLGLIAFMFILGLIFETERMRAYLQMQAALAELAKSNERLVHLNNEKNEFLGIAAHDLKNPLTIILGSAQLAGLTDDPGETRQLLDNIAGAAVRMNGLISDLLDVNAIEQGRFASAVESCDLGRLVAQSVKNNLPAAGKKMIQIQTDLAPGLLASANPAATLQILDNLVSNALKFSHPRTTIQVRTLAKANHVLVAVRDEGPGITPADQKKLFQKYTRLTARPTAGESSNGLGLAIVKRLAEAMSGAIECSSTPGAGATFTLRLPACSPAAPAAAPNKFVIRD